MKQFETIKKHIEWEKYYNPNFDWNNLDFYRENSLTEDFDFIHEFQDKVHWEYISQYQKLSEDFIREFQDKVNWDLISIKQKMSESFLREFSDKVNWKFISLTQFRGQTFSDDFIKEFQDKLYFF